MLKKISVACAVLALSGCASLNTSVSRLENNYSAESIKASVSGYVDDKYVESFKMSSSAERLRRPE